MLVLEFQLISRWWLIWPLLALGRWNLATPGGYQERRGVLQGGQPPRCQVEGCKLDPSDVKAYYSRHKVCGMHSKTPRVIVNGLEQRFCRDVADFIYSLNLTKESELS
ncbi:hypothetical protein IFM89_005693 [Coptis chinensis]|uniref:SBP-type domain-containing protein n=1 Tax=Coptis chinensis TaxID=261450 RepID=A0A835H4U5_9MAGN|nr:hypothetical protein IFM89_005693 [Coptis chinensis]